MNSLPTRENFFDRLNTVFQVSLDGNVEFEMTLIEVKTIVSNKIQECFSLLFRTAANDAPPLQQLFKLKHNDLGEMELFLVPVRKNEEGLFFEAVFNKLLA